MFVRDHKADTVDCGAGEDRVWADKLDELTGCEDAKVRGGKGKPGGKPDDKGKHKGHTRP